MKRNENLGGLALEERSIERISENIIPFIKIRLRKLDSEFFGKVDIENFATRMTNRWFSSLSDAQKEAWGIKKQEVGRRGVFTYFDATKFSEGSEALRHLEDFLIEKIEKSKARSGELEPMPSGWKTVVSLVQDDIRTADPSFADSVNLRQVAKTWMNKWLESISDAEKERWSIRRYLAKGIVVWCYSDVVWSHDSGQRSALKSFINKEVASSKKMRSEVEYIEEGWQTVNSLVERELFALKPEINTLISGVDTFVSRLGKDWAASLDDDKRKSWSIEQRRMKSIVTWCYGPESGYDRSGMLQNLRLFIENRLLSIESRGESAPQFEQNTLLITTLVGEEIFATFPDVEDVIKKVNIFKLRVTNAWVEGLTEKQKTDWQILKRRKGSNTPWTTNLSNGSKEFNEMQASIRSVVKGQVDLLKKQIENVEVKPEGWLWLGDLVSIELLKIENDLSSFVDITTYTKNAMNKWCQSLSEEERVSYGVKQCFQTGKSTRYAYNPVVLTEDSVAMHRMRESLKLGIERLKTAVRGQEKIPADWLPLATTIKEQLHIIKPGINLVIKGFDGYVSGLVESWIHNSNSAGFRQFVVKSKVAWCYPRTFFGENSEELERLRSFLRTKLERKDAKAEAKKVEQSREVLEERLIQFLKSVEDGSTPESYQFRSLIRVLGAARSIDILFSLHPKFKDIPIETVRGLLSEYLGETMLTSSSGNVSDLEALEALPKLEKSVEREFKEALVETLKDHCYKYYVTQKRAGSKLSAHDLLDAYLSNLETELRSVQGASGKESNGKTLLDHPLVGDAVMAVLEYFQDIWKIELPERVAASLKDGREFPDLAQRMNIKEVRDKKRMLIADEMGMGKSASAILSHEAAVQKAKMEGHTLAPALILVPSNVLATWRRYLSSDNAKGGCFKAGMEPKIVEIESPTDFARVEGADYVIMTQERMNQRYQAISETKWSTIIVDEMHKLKSTDGVRSSLLRDIAQRQKSDDRLVLLSGTPVPNTVRDIAVALTLLHSDQFKDTEPGLLAAQIIRGDLVEIRKYLLPRMQAKSLAESVELPPLKEGVLTCNLPPDDAMLYKTFVEEGDELDRLSKLHFLRKWLLDPSLVDQQPNTSHARKGEKARRLETRINRAFDLGATHIVVFVNDIVDGILRPSKDIHGSTALVERINLPADVKMAVIHGDVPQAERGVAQAAFQAGDGRWVLYVSGNTADVGVDYSAGDTTFFFNEPWTEYARQQQRSRVYRPGVHNAVTVESLVMEGTVEQGIHEYVQRKFHAVEKLLRGIPLTDIEKELLEKEETGGSDNILSSEIAEQYLSAWDRLMYLFSASREIGEKNFTRFVERHGKEYADLYKEFRARSFAGNVNRVCGAVVQAYSKGMDRGSDPKVLDAASGPEMLRRALPEDLAKCVTSMDLNPSMFGSTSEGPTAVGGLASMPFEKESFDVLTASLCLHYTGFQPKKGLIDRVKSFEEMQRVLKVGGWAVLALTPGKSLKNPEQFKTVMGLMGFDLVEEFTGSVHTYDSAFHLPLMTLRKRDNIDANEDLLSWTNKILEKYPEAFAFERGKRVGRHPRKMFGTCVIETTLQGNPTSLPIQVPMNEADQRIYEEEKQLMQQARNLKGIFREMKLIPPHALEQSKLSRVKMDNGSYALYSPFTTTQSGLLIGEGVWRKL